MKQHMIVLVELNRPGKPATEEIWLFNETMQEEQIFRYLKDTCAQEYMDTIAEWLTNPKEALVLEGDVWFYALVDVDEF